jgi:hypothetical protein
VNKLRKCKFAQRELGFLGHVVYPDGLAVDTDIVAVVSAWPLPDSAVQLRKFLGLGNYFRKFVQGYSSLVRPLNAPVEERGCVSVDCTMSKRF